MPTLDPETAPRATLTAILLAAGTLASCAETGARGGPDEIRAHFACADGKSIDATFINGASSRVTLALSDGRTITLPQARSGSGARYANGDESFVFWNKGDTAFIEEAGRTTYAGCATAR